MLYLGDMAKIAQQTLSFLRQLARNNDKAWFDDHRADYEAARGNVIDFANALLDRLRATDALETENGRRSLFRINRDVRFSKDKSPYKTNIAGHFVRDGRYRRGGYYFSIQPGGQTMVGGGFYGIERHDLDRLRQELAVDAQPLREIMADPDFKRVLGELRGDQLKTAPRGYPKDHENVDLLRYKQFYGMVEFPDAEVTRADFLDRATEIHLALRPFFDYFSDVLTTDANGELIV